MNKSVFFILLLCLTAITYSHPRGSSISKIPKHFNEARKGIRIPDVDINQIRQRGDRHSHKGAIKKVLECVKECENNKNEQFSHKRNHKEESELDTDSNQEIKDKKVNCHYKCIDQLKEKHGKNMYTNALDKKHKSRRH